MTAIPDALRPLLEAPAIAHLATVRPDGSPRSSPMWFLFDGERARFSHTRTRAKFRDLQANRAMTFSIHDPDDPAHYVEVRGALEEIVPDTAGSFSIELRRHYGKDPVPPDDAADRVVLVMRIDRVLGN